ncbi:MAG: protein kinase [Vicinamibacteria bacterium]|nr:protein kinase [Vicinamibacteria bacterium]
MDFLISRLYQLLAHPYIPWLILLLTLLVIYQKLLPRLRMRMPGMNLSAQGLLEKLAGSRYTEIKLEAAVKREKKNGNTLAAGRLYEEAGRPNQAVEVYLEGQEFIAAAVVIEKMGRVERAADLYLQAGDYKKAAALYVQAGKAARAAALFQERGNNVDAARLYAQAGHWDKSADLYEKSGYAHKAAESYEKKGDFHKAAECWERHFMENVTFSTTYSSTAVTPEQKSALYSGRLFEKAGDLERAFQIYERGSYFREAANVAMAQQRYSKAAEYFMRAEDAASAANAFDQAGDPVKAANLRGEVALKEDRVAEAARHFQEGQDYLRSAELFESIDMLAEAAAAYEVGESFAAAGSVYVRAGLKERAAGSYEKAGDLETAAKLYEEAGLGRKSMDLYARAGQSFKSGEAAAKSGDREKAVALLQKVPPSDDNYRRATELLAEIFIRNSQPDLAIERLQKVIANESISQTNMDLFYWLAAAYESAGQGESALDLYRKILAEDLQYRDVPQRLRRLESGASEPAGAVDRIGKYLLQDKIGQGAMGEVYRARDPILNRDVALKVITANLAADPELQARFRIEAQSAAQLNHPNIITVYDFGEEGGKAFLATELLEGIDLRRLIGKPAMRDLDRVLFIVEQICDGLAYAHSKNVVHRDLKPGNIHILPSGRVKILDFGLARLGASEITQAGQILGTPHYMAPEQAMSGAIDHRADLFTLGSVLYEMLVGRKAFEAESLPGVMNSVLTENPEPPSSRRPDIPVIVDELVRKALAKDPASRFQNAAEMKAAAGAARRALAAAPGAAPAQAQRVQPTAPPVAPFRDASESAPSPPPEQPVVVTATPAARFLRRDEVGRGPLGVVYRGEDQKSGRIVALRFLPAELLEPEGTLKAVVDDLRSASQVSHPHLAKVLGFIEMDGQHCVVSELVPGRDFAQALAAKQRLPMVQILALGKVLAQTLSAIHGQGMIHGSIQPSNVMIASGIVKLVDLGLGRLAHSLKRSPSYRAPENRLDVAGDLFALATVLYHLLTGMHPTSQQTPQVPGRIVPGVPPAFDQLIFQNLQPSPAVRSTTAEEFLKILSRTVMSR